MTAKVQRATEPIDIGQAVLNEIRQKRELAEADVNVAADQGVLTLSGVVHSDTERIAAETIARQAPGVEAVADDLEVKPSRIRSGTDVARDVIKALRNHIFLSGEHISAIVRDGGVALEGEVHSELQSLLAEAEVKRLRGVRGVANHIEVKPEAFSGEPKRNFEAGPQAGLEDGAFSANAEWVDTGEGEAG